MNKTEVKTYASDRVKCILDNSHVASGLTKDSFIKITPSGSGTSYTSGAYGEVVRSMDPSHMYEVEVVTDYGSPTDEWLMNRYKRDRDTYDGMFDMMIRDLGSNPLFKGQECSIANIPENGYSSTAATHTWKILVAYGDYDT